MNKSRLTRQPRDLKRKMKENLRRNKINVSKPNVKLERQMRGESRRNRPKQTRLLNK